MSNKSNVSPSRMSKKSTRLDAYLSELGEEPPLSHGDSFNCENCKMRITPKNVVCHTDLVLGQIKFDIINYYDAEGLKSYAESSGFRRYCYNCLPYMKNSILQFNEEQRQLPKKPFKTVKT